MFYVLLFVICTLAIPIAFEIHYKGSDNILNRAGKELLEKDLVRKSMAFTGEMRAWAAAVWLLLITFFVIVLILRVLSWLLGSLF
jgi:hypothetical protein